jgi:hypothetical protein
MKNPQALQNSDQHLKTLVHGDLWHNNIYFGSKNVMFSSWQMTHIGSVSTDLSFFLCSSTTTSFRKQHWDRVIRLYFDEFVANLKDLVTIDLEQNLKIPTYEDFMLDVKASLPASLFFCANLRDLDNDDESMASLAPSGHDEATNSKIIKNLRGSFCKLQSSYSEVHTTTINEDKDEDDDDDDEDDDEGGIIISFGSNATSEKCAAAGYNGKPLKSNVANVKQQHEYKRTHSDTLILDRKPVTKVPTVATDKELLDILAGRSNGHHDTLNPRRARALRRKLYLDLNSEVAQRMLI